MTLERAIKIIDKNNMLDGSDFSEALELVLDTIETLQQENKQLRAQLAEWKYETKCHIDEVVAREKQMTQIKEALRKAKETINTKNKAHWFECDRCRDVRDALAAIDILEGKKNV